MTIRYVCCTCRFHGCNPFSGPCRIRQYKRWVGPVICRELCFLLMLSWYQIDLRSFHHSSAQWQPPPVSNLPPVSSSPPPLHPWPTLVPAITPTSQAINVASIKANIPMSRYEGIELHQVADLLPCHGQQVPSPSPCWQHRRPRLGSTWLHSSHVVVRLHIR